ncbi:MAG: hypothetical protein AAGJ68_01210 [Pseudomonadota bacterium]
MSPQPQVVPMMLEIDDLDVDDEFEAREAESEEGKSGGLLGFIKSPIGMGAIGGTAILIGAVAFLFGSGTVQGFGTPQLNNQSPNAEDTIALSSASIASEQVDMKVDGDEVAAGGDTRVSGNSVHGGADRRDVLEEVKAPTYGEITYSKAGAVYHTAPTTVSLQMGETHRELTLSMGILADRETAQLLKDEGLTVNLLKVEAAQSVDFGPVLDWEIPGLITKDLRTRLETTFPGIEVRAIMIRDFQL